VALPALAPDRTIRIATLPQGDDPDTLVRGQGQAAFASVLVAARPLSEALFDLLKEVGAAETPEQRAAFRARLAAAAARIGDKGLAAEYRRDLLDRFFQSFRRGKPALPPRHAPRPVPAETTASAERVRTLIAILLRHPVLLPRLEEAFANLALPPRAQHLHEALLAYADTAEHLDFTGLIAHLTSLRLADDCAWALGEVPFPLPACAGPDATAEEAESGWWLIYGLMRRGSLEAEVAAASRDFAAQPSEAAQQRLIALCAALESSRRGDLGQDAVSDD
jgi:DNA primase